MKVFITGGAGFVGSHAAGFYAERGEDVIVFDNLSRGDLLNKEIKPEDYSLDYLKKFPNIQFIKGDIRNKAELESSSKGADIIIHAAAQTAVTSSIINPDVDFEVNSIGTFNVLEAA